jgi:hypothetical protein
VHDGNVPEELLQQDDAGDDADDLDDELPNETEPDAPTPPEDAGAPPQAG